MKKLFYLFISFALLSVVACNKTAKSTEETDTIIVEDSLPRFDSTSVSMGDVSMQVKVSDTTLYIIPAGFELVNDTISHSILGESVVDVKVADLDGNGFPEFYIFLMSDGSGSYGNLTAYASNENKSLSQISYDGMAGIDAETLGYMGHDVFKLENNTLTRNFPLYNADDTNANPTKGTCTLTYTLKKGEASFNLIIDQIAQTSVMATEE